MDPQMSFQLNVVAKNIHTHVTSNDIVALSIKRFIHEALEKFNYSMNSFIVYTLK